MKITNESPWIKIRRGKKFPKLAKNTRTEVCVIGAGMAGLLTAYFLARQGRRVVLLENDQVGSGASAYTTAMTTEIIDTNLADLIDMHGPATARKIIASHRGAIEALEHIAKKEKIDCDFRRCDAYVYAIGKKQSRELAQEYQAAKKLRLKTTLGPENLRSLRATKIWTIPGQAKFHPVKFMIGLARVCQALGVKIYEQTEVQDIEEQENSVIVSMSKHSVVADFSVMTTYRPFKNPIQTLFKKGMYKTYEIQALLPKGALPPGLYWDLANPYYYLRLDEGTKRDSLLLGGEDHRSEIKMDPKKLYRSLEKYLQTILPGIKYEITNRWPGPILEPSDGLALIGTYSPRQLLATAFSGNGMTYSAITGRLLGDLIAGKPNPYAKIYDPKRIPSLYQLYVKGRDYTGELVGGAVKNIIEG